MGVQLKLPVHYIEGSDRGQGRVIHSLTLVLISPCYHLFTGNSQNFNVYMWGKIKNVTDCKMRDLVILYVQ